MLMKRFGIIALCAIIAISLLFTSCKKEQEGVYNPKKKIERIYKEIQDKVYDNNEVAQLDVPKYLCEEWNWNGDKLNTITYYGDDGAQFETATFSYEGNRISQIYEYFTLQGEQGYCYSFVYQNDLISSIRQYYDQELCGEYQFTHTGNKITRIELYYKDYKKKIGQSSLISPLSFILPNMNMEDTRINRFDNKKSEGLVIGYTYELEWDGENISKVKFRVDDYNEQYEYSYDTKMNPFYGSFLGIHENGSGVVFDGIPWVTSKNNIITMRYTDFEGWNVTETRNYSYKGKYPVTCTREGTRPNGTYREISYYEYQ